VSNEKKEKKNKKKEMNIRKSEGSTKICSDIFHL